MTAARYKIDADTSALSMKLNRAKGQMTQLGNTVSGIAPGFGAMATSAGAVASAGLLAKKHWDEYWRNLKEANRDMASLRQNAEAIAFAVGRPEISARVAGVAEEVAKGGRATEQELLASGKRLTDAFPSASLAQITSGMQAAGRIRNLGGTSEDAELIAQAMGLLFESDPSMDGDRAANLAIQLTQGLGQNARTILNMLPSLLAVMTPEEATAVALSLKGAGKTRASRLNTATNQFFQEGGQGGLARLTQITARLDQGLADRISGATVSANAFAEQEARFNRVNPGGNVENIVGGLESEASATRRNAFADDEERLRQARIDAFLAAEGYDPITSAAVNIKARLPGGGRGAALRYLAALGSFGLSEIGLAITPSVTENPNNE